MDAPVRTAEEELLDLLQAARREGTIACDGGAPPAPAPELRLDVRLTCAARVLARDLEATRAQSLVDSAGRDTTERMTLAGYAAGGWGEVFTFQADDAAQALAMLEAGVTSCPFLVDELVSDVGVGRAGDVFVVTLANERRT